MKPKRPKTTIHRLPKPRPGVLTEEQLRTIALTLTTTLTDALDTMLKSNLALAKANEALAERKLTS